jgi:hypothetical protein
MIFGSCKNSRNPIADFIPIAPVGFNAFDHLYDETVEER